MHLRRSRPDPDEPELRAYPAYALAAIVVVVYVVGKLNPVWLYLLAGVLGLLLITWITAVVVDLVGEVRRRP